MVVAAHELTEEDRDRLARLDGPIHGWFELTYANYQVLHRSLMQSMPVEWQERMVVCLEEMQRAFTNVEQAASYRVNAINESGRFIRDPVPHYNRGRTFVEPRI